MAAKKEVAVRRSSRKSALTSRGQQHCILPTFFREYNSLLLVSFFSQNNSAYSQPTKNPLYVFFPFTFRSSKLSPSFIFFPPYRNTVLIYLLSFRYMPRSPHHSSLIGK